MGSFFQRAEKDIFITDRYLPYIAMARAYLDKQNPKRASEILSHAPSSIQIDDIVELAVLYKRAGLLKEAHTLFASNYDLLKDDPKSIHEFAQTKMKLASSIKGNKDLSTKMRLNREAAELLRRAIQLSDDSIRNALCWFDLARTLAWFRSPETEVLQAYTKAVEILPKESRFLEWYKRLNAQKSKRPRSES